MSKHRNIKFQLENWEDKYGTNDPESVIHQIYMDARRLARGFEGCAGFVQGPFLNILLHFKNTVHLTTINRAVGVVSEAVDAEHVVEFLQQDDVFKFGKIQDTSKILAGSKLRLGDNQQMRQYIQSRKNRQFQAIKQSGALSLTLPGPLQIPLLMFPAAQRFEIAYKSDLEKKAELKWVDELQSPWYSDKLKRNLKFHLNVDKKRHYAITSPPNFGKSTFFKQQDSYMWSSGDKGWHQNYKGEQFVVFDAWDCQKLVPWSIIEKLTADKSQFIFGKRHNKDPIRRQRYTVIILTNMDDPFTVYGFTKDTPKVKERFNLWNLQQWDVKPFKQPDDRLYI